MKRIHIVMLTVALLSGVAAVWLAACGGEARSTNQSAQGNAPTGSVTLPASPAQSTTAGVPLMGDIPLLGGALQPGDQVVVVEKLGRTRRNLNPSRRPLASDPYQEGRTIDGDGTEELATSFSDTNDAPDTSLDSLLARESRTPGSGCMVARHPKEPRLIPVPLKHTDVQASIAGAISSVQVLQQFHNPFDGKIEAVYVFPLPETAAVSDFVMTIGDRRIRGIIREREEAQRIYAEARSQGYTASLLTQERPNIFTQKVANIEPGKQINVTITYYGPLNYSDGQLEFVFPMVVGPRFNPPGTTDGIGAVPRDARGSSGQSTEVSYLAPKERSGHDISVSVNIDAGVPIKKVHSPSHVVHVTTTGPTTASVALAATDTIPNKDFVLRCDVSADNVQSGVIAMRDERGGFFSMLIVPPKTLESVPRGPVELVFVLDSSGSMNGRPIEQAKAAIARGLKRMDSGDTFQMINFSNTASALGSAPLKATPENLSRGRRYLDELNAQGGTMMIEGIKAALNFPHDDSRLRFVVFLTDGYIGNEAEILHETDARLADSRVFSFGVGPSTNRYLMDSMARMGRGFANYLSLEESSSEVMDAFFDRVSHAALTDVQLDFEGARVTETYPRRLPDVFHGRPVMIMGRFDGPAPRQVRAHGRVGEGPGETIAPVHEADDDLVKKALPAMWARAKIADVSERALAGKAPDADEEIRRVALDFGLMSAYTAFVAVDSSRRTEGEYGTSVNVPVPVPEGVRYETTVSEGKAGRNR